MKGFILLTQFMTRIPVPVKTEYNEEKLGKAFRLFPILGLIIGIFLSLIYALMYKLTENVFLIAITIVIAETLITGGLHLDGLADTFDAIYSYRPRDQMLEIMKDSRVGTNGVLVLILYYLLKVACLAELGWKYIILMSVLSRLSSVINAGLGTYARKKGFGGPMIQFSDKRGIFIASCISFVVAFALGEIIFIIITAASILFSLYFLHSINKKIGGITGDTLGCVLELSSLFVLFLGVIL